MKKEIDTRPIRTLFDVLYPSEMEYFLEKNVLLLTSSHITTVFSLRNAILAESFPEDLHPVIVRDLKSYFETKIQEKKEKKTFSIGHLMKILWSARFSE